MCKRMVTKWVLQLVLLACFVFHIPVRVHSQPAELRRLSITPVAPPSAGIPVFTDHPDKAGIIIESPITNLSFTSNMDGIVEQRSELGRGRYILILEPFTQIITVDAPGFITGRFRVANPQARDVLYYEVRPEQVIPDLVPAIFNVEPADARLYVDDQLTETNRTVQLPPGVKQLRLEREGYRVIEDVITVSMDNVLFTYRMEEIDIVPVRITANVPGTRVLIDGIEQGTIDNSGNFGHFLYPGQYAVSLQMSGYLPENTTIEVGEDGENRFVFQLEPSVGILVLDVTPADAQVRINRQDYSRQRRVELAPGRYRLEVEKQGHDPHSEMVEIVLNQTLSRSISLPAHIGSLQFTVTPGNAQVRLRSVEGQILQSWEGINLLRGLPVGGYRLEVSAQGYRTQTRDVAIQQNETSHVRVELEPHRVTQRTQPVRETHTVSRDAVPPTDRALSWLISGEILLLPSDAFKRNYGSPLMPGLSVGLLRPVLGHGYLRIGSGGLFTPTSNLNVVNQSGNLWFIYGQSALGIGMGHFKAEASATMGSFMLADERADEVLMQSFFYAGIGVGISFTIGFDAMVTYALYSEPQHKSLMGVRLSWRIGQ